MMESTAFRLPAAPFTGTMSRSASLLHSDHALQLHSGQRTHCETGATVVSNKRLQGSIVSVQTIAVAATLNPTRIETSCVMQGIIMSAARNVHITKSRSVAPETRTSTCRPYPRAPY